MKTSIIYLLLIFCSLPLLAGSTSVHSSSIPARVDSQQVSLSGQLQIFDSLFKSNLNLIVDSLKKQAIISAGTPKKENWWKENSGWIKDWGNIVFFGFNTTFFICVIIYTERTFRISRQSLFNPLRTEIFKKQFEIYSELVKIFDNKSFGSIKDCAFVNVLVYIKDMYSFAGESNYINMAINDDKFRPYFEKLKYRIPIDECLITGEKNSNMRTLLDEDKRSIIADIKVDEYTSEVLNAIHSFSESPFLPDVDQNKNIIDKLKEIENLINYNLKEVLPTIVNKQLKILLKQLDTTKDVKKSIEHIYSYALSICAYYSGKSEKYESKISELKKEIKSYLSV